MSGFPGRLLNRLLRQAENEHAFQQWQAEADRLQGDPTLSWLNAMRPDRLSRSAIMRVEDGTEDGRVVLYPELTKLRRTAGRHRQKGKRRMS